MLVSKYPTTSTLTTTTIIIVKNIASIIRFYCMN